MTGRPSNSDALGVIFQEIIADATSGEWSPHKQRLAWQLATDIQSWRREMNKLRKEGFVITVQGSQGQTKIVRNPRADIVKALHAQVIRMRQSLGIQGASPHARGAFPARTEAMRNRHAYERQLDDIDEMYLAKPD